MSGTGFVVAMQAVIELARYDNPMAKLGSHAEWLIVSRWGGDGDFLSISRTGVTPEEDGDAPEGLQPTTTFLGMQMSGRDAASESSFLMVRHCPPGVTVAGVFAPSDGYAHVILAGGMLSLEAAGRYAHSRGEHQGQRVLHDVPDPPPRPSLASAWHVTARRRAWSGEFFPFA